MKSEVISSKIRLLFEKTVAKNKILKNGILLVHSDKLNIHWKYATGLVGKGKNPITENHTFHIASIGKSFTSALIGKLYEENKISYDDPIAKYLSNDILKDLHLVEGQSYSDKILIHHLLNHTSGISDYFEEKPKKGKSILELVVDEPNHFWSPLDTIQWGKENLKSHFRPGEGFYYSDTGYQLLGLVVEAITGKPMWESLHKNIFEPLNMNSTYQLFYSEPLEKSLNPIADIYLNLNEVSENMSLSVDWAGGGIISNSEDLLRFHKALVKNTLLKEETFNRWKDWAKLARGIDYGYGLVRIKFNDFLFFLPKKLNIWGNFGSIATFMFYNPAFDIYSIGTFNQSNYAEKQVQFLLKLMMKVSKLSSNNNDELL